MAKQSENEIRKVQLQDYEGFLKEIKIDSDRAKAILAGVYLEQCLALLLENFLIDDPFISKDLFDSVTGPLNTFNQKTKLAYYLGLISEQEYKDLNVIRDIRNDFAHGMHGITFEDQSIKDKCENLLIPNQLKRKYDIRNKFLVSVFLLVSLLNQRASEIRTKRRKKADDLILEDFIKAF